MGRAPKRSRQGRRVRSEDVAGPFANGSYTVTDSESELRVVPERRQVIRFRASAARLFEAYRALGPEDQAQVRRSLMLVGPDLPYYLEQSPARIADREIHGLRASCCRLTSRILGDVSERCYWRGILVFVKGKNPIDGSDIEREATRIVIDGPVDDANFFVSKDFSQEVSSTDAIMGEVEAKLVERMKEPRFGLEHFDRYATVPR